MLGETIKKARIKAGLSQKKLGMLCGYSEASAERIIQHWEHDRRDPPVEKLRDLANALNMTIDDLIP